ncbi:hypothetical protein [Nonomuraea wenchangensis]|uniref:Uncharacterized protein n=1 Tax=Nonomuraea wenchangensis TaxID=568860 RepID=A0A1I0LTN4_9ACTN|nr:hypothetical protein [Nonomuraea wenchangensis]SEU46439.1 hypothetical protein SAMN05421811_12734 [Nonomuraea wenchangensis]
MISSLTLSEVIGRAMNAGMTPAEVTAKVFRALIDHNIGQATVPEEDLRVVVEVAANYLDMCEPPPEREMAALASVRAHLRERA